MDRDGLLDLSQAIRATPSLADVRFARGARHVHWLTREAPQDTLALTHPRTSTEFFIRWEPESADRLAVLPGGQACERAYTPMSLRTKRKAPRLKAPALTATTPSSEVSASPCRSGVP